MDCLSTPSTGDRIHKEEGVTHRREGRRMEDRFRRRSGFDLGPDRTRILGGAQKLRGEIKQYKLVTDEKGEKMVLLGKKVA